MSVPKGNSGNADSFQQKIDYGDYDFKYQGFAFTRDYFRESVVPIVGKTASDMEDIGTCYYIGNNQFVTAAHCITGLKRFNVLNHANESLEIKEILFPKNKDQDLDLAIINVKDAGKIPMFELTDPEILDEVLVMGYPPIPGFDAILTAETASVGAYIKTVQKGAVGEVVSDAKSYLNRLDFFLINARVKGGNSGGPVINSHGRVIGTVSQLPLDSA